MPKKVYLFFAGTSLKWVDMMAYLSLRMPSSFRTDPLPFASETWSRTNIPGPNPSSSSSDDEGSPTAFILSDKFNNVLSSPHVPFLYYCFDGVGSGDSKDPSVDISTPTRSRWDFFPRRGDYRASTIQASPNFPPSLHGLSGDGMVENALFALNLVKFLDDKYKESNPQDPLLEVNLVGFSRGGATCVMLANFIQTYFNGMISVNLFLMDPVPGRGLRDQFVSAAELDPAYELHTECLDAALKNQLAVSTTVVPECVKRCFVALALEERRLGFEPLDATSLCFANSNKTKYVFSPFSEDHSSIALWTSGLLKSFYPELRIAHVDPTTEDGHSWREFVTDMRIRCKQGPEPKKADSGGIPRYFSKYTELTRDLWVDPQNPNFLKALDIYYTKTKYFNDPDRSFGRLAPSLPFDCPNRAIKGVGGIMQFGVMTVGNTRAVVRDLDKYTSNKRLFLNIHHEMCFSRVYPFLYAHLRGVTLDAEEMTKAQTELQGFSKRYPFFYFELIFTTFGSTGSLMLEKSTHQNLFSELLRVSFRLLKNPELATNIDMFSPDEMSLFFMPAINRSCLVESLAHFTFIPGTPLQRVLLKYTAMSLAAPGKGQEAYTAVYNAIQEQIKRLRGTSKGKDLQIMVSKFMAPHELDKKVDSQIYTLRLLKAVEPILQEQRSSWFKSKPTTSFIAIFETAKRFGIRMTGALTCFFIEAGSYISDLLTFT